ncbi:hypothetical protein A3Q56_01830 [Intoshia linei]|uniref:CID domain-containing protein n=1 Tax=Intoshia linei TaxID=1819745 RepID=A0A177B7X6_9BILA|nr:hypothetical protein A3Q56_01830 [Intoshia linei]
MLSKTSTLERLDKLNNTSESIRKFALYAFKNKEESDILCDIWARKLRELTGLKFVTYFYAANEILQTCLKNRAAVYRNSFKRVLPAAVRISNGKAYSDKIKRVIEIWKERGVYSSDYTTKLISILTGSKVDQICDVQELNTEDLIIQLREFDETSEKNMQIYKKLQENPMYDVCSEDVSKNKDRDSVRKFDAKVQNFHEEIADYAQAIDEEICSTEKLIVLLNCCDSVFSNHFTDVQYVVSAYQDYAEKIEKSCDFVNARIKKIENSTDDLDSPPSSPDINCPSPTDTFGNSDEENRPITVPFNMPPPMLQQNTQIFQNQNSFPPQNLNYHVRPESLIQPRFIEPYNQYIAPKRQHFDDTNNQNTKNYSSNLRFPGRRNNDQNRFNRDSRYHSRNKYI